VEVLGVTDHHIFKSIYFFDPNGIRLELTAQLADAVQMARESTTAHARLAEWTARKQQWRAERAAGASSTPSSPSTTTGRNTAAALSVPAVGARPGARGQRHGVLLISQHTMRMPPACGTVWHSTIDPDLRAAGGAG
jgi:hypothetical protein